MKDSFVFYKSYFNALSFLKDEKSFQKVVNAICLYAFDGKEIKESNFDNTENAILTLIKPLLDAANDNYKNGMKGGRPSKINAEKAFELKEQGLTNSQIAEFFNTTKRAIEIFFQERKNEKTTEKTPKKPNDNVNVNVNVNEKENVNVNVNEKENLKEFNNYLNSIPTLSEINEFAKSQKLNLDTQEFFDYYEATNWQNVYNWQKLLVRWEERQMARKRKDYATDPYAKLR